MLFYAALKHWTNAHSESARLLLVQHERSCTSPAMCTGQVEHTATYCTLLFVVGGVVVASGVEPNLHLFGASVCFLAAALRGLRAVLQAILLRPEEKLDSISCLAYMVPVSSVLMFVLCGFLEPRSYSVIVGLPAAGLPMLAAISANCAAAFFSNYLNMAVTRRTSALSIQVRCDAFTACFGLSKKFPWHWSCVIGAATHGFC
jgi:hypothetical protein